MIRFEEVYTSYQDSDNYTLGEIKHAIRVTFSYLQSAYISPATHSDGQCGHDSDCAPMGLRFRLKADYDISGFAPPLQIILQAMKTYGLMVADTGGDLFVSGDHDIRWDDDLLHDLTTVTMADFEAVETGAITAY